MVGWESIQATGWWSGFFFWASIVSLIGLGISEVASHRFSERKDELVERQQIADKERHDADMARVQHDAALAIERAASLEKDAESSRAAIADANARAAEANRLAESERLARLELEARVAPRRIRGEQRQEMIAVLSAARPSGIAVVSRLLDSEGQDFAEDIAAVFKASKWQEMSFSNWTRSDKGVFIATVEGTAPEPTDLSLVVAALDAAKITHTTIVISGEDINRMSPHFQPLVLYLLIGAKP
jgi:hypothetical protein